MVIIPEATRAALLYPLTTVLVIVTVRGVPATALARIPNPDPQPPCWDMSNTLTSLTEPPASLNKIPNNETAQSIAKPLPWIVRFSMVID